MGIGRAEKFYESTKLLEAFSRSRVVLRSNVLRNIIVHQSFFFRRRKSKTGTRIQRTPVGWKYESSNEV